MSSNLNGDRRPTTVRSDSAASDGQYTDAAETFFDTIGTNSGRGAQRFGPGAAGAGYGMSFTARINLQVAPHLAAGFAPAAGVILKTVVAKPSPAVAPAPAVTPTVIKASATPGWIVNLKTTSIRNDMTAAAADGVVSYSELLKLLTDVNATLAASRTQITSTQLTDLKTVTANLGNSLTTSAYLKNIMGALVNGDAANATWTGGGKNSIRLGNLAVGFNTTQFSELIGKWFLGTDLPSSQVVMDSTRFNIWYSNSNSPVFGASGPSMNDINQGYLGDCYLLSTLAEVACKTPGVISSMITDNGNGTYGVRFYVNGQADYVTVNRSLADGGSIFNYGKNIWSSLVEKAYAQFQAGGVTTGNLWSNYGNSWSTIGNGGWPRYALETITGAASITDFTASGSSWSATTYNQRLAATGYSAGYSTSSVSNTLIADLAAGYDLILTSWTDARNSAGKTTLVAGHAMSIYGYNSATNMFQIRNPWGAEAGQTWATTFEVSLSTLLAAGDTITVNNNILPGMGTLSGLMAGLTGSGRLLSSDPFPASIPAAAASLTQAISSMPSTSGSLTPSLTQLASATPTTLAPPAHT